MFRYRVLICFSVYCIAIGAPASPRIGPIFADRGQWSGGVGMSDHLVRDRERKMAGAGDGGGFLFAVKPGGAGGGELDSTRS